MTLDQRIARCPMAGASSGMPARGLWSALFGLARDPLGYLLDAQRRSGDVVKLSLAHRSFVLVSHPDGVRRVLVDNAGNYDKLTPTFEKIRGIVGSSLLTAEGDAWLERRRAAQPGFLENRVAELGPILADSTHRLIEQWRRTAPGEPIDLGSAMTGLTLDIAVRALLGRNLEGNATSIGEAAEAVIRQTNRRIESWLDCPASLPTPANLRFRRARRRLDEAVEQILDKPTSEAADILERLRRSCQNQPEPKRALRDEIMTMLLAGHETTANLLTWAVDAIVRRPAILGELRREHEHVIGRGPLDANVLPGLAFAKQTLQEVLRLKPPVWILERRAIDADRIGGHDIAPGTIVAMSAYVTQRRPDLWPQPDAFDPSRFDAHADRMPHCAYFPFGAGAHQCIGGHFATIEALFAITLLCDAFDIEPLGPTPAAAAGVTLRPKHPLLVRVRARKWRQRPKAG